jgi:hypothetical protein
MGLISWFRRKPKDAPPEVTLAPAAPPASEDDGPVPPAPTIEPRSPGPALVTIDSGGAADPAQLRALTVRRFFAGLAAATAVTYDRSAIIDWRPMSVERYFLTISGPKPTLNRAGKTCSTNDLGNVDTAFASFQWD